MLAHRQIHLRAALAQTATPARLPIEKEARDRLDYPVWGPPLTIEGYLQRELQLCQHPFSEGMRLHLLLDAENDKILASCESYPIDVVVSSRGRKAEVKGKGHGIASVFVEESERKKGYASKLLSLVHGVLKAEGVLLTYLISEVGAAIYERLGYLARPLSLRRFSAPAQGDPEPGLDKLTWLSRKDMAAAVPAIYGVKPQALLALQLSPEQLDWHVERSVIYAAALSRKAPDIVGARCGDAFVIFAPNYRRNLLYVLTLFPGSEIASAGALSDPRSPTAAALRNVLHGARAMAAHYGVDGVEIWENAANRGWLRGGQQGGAADVPMICPLSADVDASRWLDWERGHWL